MWGFRAWKLKKELALIEDAKYRWSIKRSNLTSSRIRETLDRYQTPPTSSAEHELRLETESSSRAVLGAQAYPWMMWFLLLNIQWLCSHFLKELGTQACASTEIMSRYPRCCEVFVLKGSKCGVLAICTEYFKGESNKENTMCLCSAITREYSCGSQVLTLTGMARNFLPTKRQTTSISHEEVHQTTFRQCKPLVCGISIIHAERFWYIAHTSGLSPSKTLWDIIPAFDTKYSLDAHI